MGAAVPKRARLFVAFDLPAEHLEEVERTAAALEPLVQGARWTRPEQRHVTLKFIGAVDEAKIADAGDVCRTVAEENPRCELRLSGLGAFPSRRRARVLWLGIEEVPPAGAVTRLAADLDAGFEDLVSRSEDRAYAPHLTLARLKQPQDLRRLPTASFDHLGPFTLEEVVLYRSYLGRGGATYEVVGRFPLR